MNKRIFKINVRDLSKEEQLKLVENLKKELHKPVSFSEEDNLKIKDWMRIETKKLHPHLSDDEVDEHIKKTIECATVLYKIFNRGKKYEEIIDSK